VLPISPTLPALCSIAVAANDPRDPVADLLAFLDRSPTPYHAVAEARRRLEAAGFRELVEADAWDLAPGDRRFAVRGGSLLALQIGSVSPAEGGFRVVGAHTDSPNLRLRPRADAASAGYQRYGVEPYGGVLLHTWLDRDLSLAGCVTLREGGALRTVLLDFGRPLLRIPNLAIHLDREVNQRGLVVDPQAHLVPVAGLEGAPGLAALVAMELRAQGIAAPEPGDVLAHDLMTYDAQRAVVAGVRGEFIHSSRLDNLGSCHAGLSALLAAAEGELPGATRVLVLYDHEEVGSRSAEGAAGPFLATALERAVAGFKGGSAQGLPRALARSLLVSADMAHAVHPNHAERHEGSHRPLIGAGPVIKQNAGRSYATDARTAAHFAELCAQAGIAPQHFVTRNDVPCGSTIGPITAARVGVPAVDVGSPMLSMHSCREMAGTADVRPMIEVLRRFYA
jgi:aspartyl aminopeptidase